MAVSLYCCAGFRSGVRRNSNLYWPDNTHLAVGGSALRLRSRQCLSGGFRVHCSAEDGESKRSGDEDPESLFVKEVKRRGMNTSSLLEASEEEVIGISKTKNTMSTEIQESLSNQRERSMALNSEGIEGLVPRAKVLLATGGTFFIGFWPIIAIIVAFFSALYLYLGPSFIHLGNTHTIPYSYIDPSTLLQDERIS